MAFVKKDVNRENSQILSYYLSLNINNICRICLEKSTKLTPIFDPIKPPHFSLLIMACASIQVGPEFRIGSAGIQDGLFRCRMETVCRGTFASDAFPD